MKNDKQKLDVFLCHASGDKPAVKSLYARLLLEKNVEPWLDQERLLPGQNWDLEIRNAVSKTDVILVCLSKQSVNKEGYVQKEIRLALDVADEKLEEEIFLIPLKLEECAVPSRLSTWQWLNYFEESAYERLLQSLQKRADHFGIKIGKEEKSLMRSEATPPVLLAEINAPNLNPSRINNRPVETKSTYFILQHSMLKEKAAQRNITNIFKSPIETQVKLFFETLQGLEEYLDTGDLRKLNSESLGVIRDDMLEIISGLRNLPRTEARRYFKTLDGILENLRLARDGLETSLAMMDIRSSRLTDTKSKKFFTELREVRRKIDAALKYFL